MLVVCSGVKSILDVAATLEVLETGSVPVLGYRTDAFPGFYRRDSGHPVGWRVDSPPQAAAVWRAHRGLGGRLRGGAGPTGTGGRRAGRGPARPNCCADGLALLAERGVTGKDVTPMLLEHFHTASGGASLRANLALVAANAGLAAEVAVALATGPGPA